MRTITCVLSMSTAVACGTPFSTGDGEGGGFVDASAGASDASPSADGASRSNTGAGGHIGEGGETGSGSGGGMNGASGGTARGGSSGQMESGGTTASAGSGSGGAASGGKAGSGSGGATSGGTAGSGSGGAASGGKAGSGSGGAASGGKAGSGSGGVASGGTAGSGSGGVSCQNGAPQCSDGTCARLSWSFDSGSLDGVVRVSSPHALEVRDFGGNAALAADVDQLNTLLGISFVLPICSSGSIDIHSKTLSFRVYFDGTQVSTPEFYVQTSSPSPEANAYLDQIGVRSGAWTTYSSPLSRSAYSSSTASVAIQAGSLGAPFSGTIWFDDFAIR